MLVLYIHGFNSSPASYKSRYFKQFLDAKHPGNEFICPELPDYPQQAIELLSRIIESSQVQSIALVGSSLGGFYAAWLANKYNLRAVLINPAVNPQELLVDLLGKNTNYYSGREYELTREHIEQLKALQVGVIENIEKFMVLLQTGDEVLDYRLANKKYIQSHLIIEQGGNHSFEDFPLYCEEIYQFLAG